MSIAAPRRRRFRFVLAACIVLLVATGIGATEPPAPPAPPGKKPERIPIAPAPTTYMGRTIATTMHYAGAPWLMRESREREEDSKLLLATLAIEPGMTICDMGSGNGFYTIPMAKLTGATGRVYAVDIQQPMLDMLEVEAKEADVENIVPVLSTVVDPRLPEASIDLMLLVDVYHEMSHPEQMLAAMRKALKPDGHLVLVEFRGEDPKVPIKPLHKMSKAQTLKEYEPNGFRLVKTFDELPWQHMLWFRVADDAERRVTLTEHTEITEADLGLPAADPLAGE